MAAAAPGAERIVIVPRLAGRPVATGTPVAAQVGLSTRDPARGRSLRTRLVDGTITVEDVDAEDYTGVGVVIDTDPSNPIGMPGDLVAKVDRWSPRREGRTRRGVVDMRQIMRLVRPEDTRLGVARSANDAPPAFHSPMTFAWDRVPGATSYRVDVFIKWRPTRPTTMPLTTRETSCTVALEPTAPGESYELSITAYRERELIGELTIDGSDMRDSAYRFRVVSPEERADEPAPPSRAAVGDVFGGSARLVFVPTLDGRPWALPQSSWVRVSLSSETTVGITDVRPTGGVAELGELIAGTYTAGLLVEGAADGPSGPRTVCRAYTGDQPLDIRLSERVTTRLEVPLRCTMELRRSARAWTPQSGPVELSSPVTFEWTPVPEAVRYTYEVQRSGAGTDTVVAHGEGDATTWTTALEPSLLAGEYYRIDVTAHGRREDLGSLDNAYVFRVAGGTPQAGVGRITLVPTFDGAPLARTKPVPTEVTLGRANDVRTVNAQLAGGVIELPDLETGVYQVSFVLNEESPGSPHDDAAMLMSADTAPVGLLRNGESVRHEIAMYAPFELVAPPVAALGSTTPRGSAPEIPMLRSPVRIAWKPVRGAKRYRVSLETPYSDGEEPETRVSENAIPEWSSPLPPTAPKSYYFVIIEAHGAHAQVGATLFRFGVEGYDATGRGR